MVLDASPPLRPKLFLRVYGGDGYGNAFVESRTPQGVVKEVKEAVKLGLVPVLLGPDGQETPLYSVREARPFLQQARKDPLAYICTQEEYEAAKRKAA